MTQFIYTRAVPLRIKIHNLLKLTAPIAGTGEDSSKE